MEACPVGLLTENDGPVARNLGSLTLLQGEKRMRLPLSSVQILARVEERIAGVSLSQTFVNPLNEPLEAIYTFPLAGGSAVTSFEATVGSRVLKGLVRERGAARHEYREAIKKGHRAGLLEQERDNIFTVQLGNLPPGEEVVIRIQYCEQLPFFEDGTTELRMPLVAAPRYIPGTPLDRDSVGNGVEEDTDRVPDASRISPPRFAPGVDPQVALKIEVELPEGAPEDLLCSQHAIRISSGRIVLTRQNELMNRDFILRWRLAGEKLRTSFLLHKASNGDSYGMLSIIPPRSEKAQKGARDVVFLIDRSGSMSGAKMASATRACSLLLATLGPGDRFSICAFDDQALWFAREFMRADEGGIAAGRRFLQNVQANGGTELGTALSEAMQVAGGRDSAEPRTPVIVLITDGQVGDETAVKARIQKQLGTSRIFAIGIDTAVNEPFLQWLARAGGGTFTPCTPGDSLEEALEQIGRDIGSPLAVDLKLEGCGEMPVPERLPDLFSGRAITVFMKIPGGVVLLTGLLTSGGVLKESVRAKQVDMPAIASLWARGRVTDLEDRFRMGEEVREELIRLGIEHNLLTRFTAFVVVDESEVVNAGGEPRIIVQPVHMPTYWEMSESVVFACFAQELLDRDSEAVGLMGLDAMPRLYRPPRSGPDLRAKSPQHNRIGAPLKDLLAELVRLKALCSNHSSLDNEELRKLQSLLKNSRRAHRHDPLWKPAIAFLDGPLTELIAALSSGALSHDETGRMLDTLEAQLRGIIEELDRESFWERSI